MKAITSLVAGAALAASLVAGPAHASDFLTLRAKVKKYAAVVDGAPRTLCICHEPSQFNDVGYTTHTTPPTKKIAQEEIFVWCAVPTFDSAGNLIAETGCYDFSALAK
jgi:hypothetical protein